MAFRSAKVSFVSKACVVTRAVCWAKATKEESSIIALVYDACELPLDFKGHVSLRDSSGAPVTWASILKGDVKDVIVELQVEEQGDEYADHAFPAHELTNLLEKQSLSSSNDNSSWLGYFSTSLVRSEREGYTKIPSKPNDGEETGADGSSSRVSGGSSGLRRVSSKGNVLEQRVEPLREFRGASYQNQLTKFNRILAHLVNERTVLAWFRTNLAFVILSFKYMKLADTYENIHSIARILLYLCGGLFMLVLPFSWYSGFRRFQKCKEMLDYDITRISAYLHKMGFDLDNIAFGLLIFTSFFAITLSSTLIIWSSSTTASSNDDAGNVDDFYIVS